MGPAENILRWRIAILVSTAIAISYLDRQTLPVAIKAISRDIPLTNEQFSTLQSAFLFAYALMYAGGGRLVDVLGTRLGLTAIMLFWSFACASHALATGFAMLAISRFLLGVGEGGGFPAATRAVAEWFPIQERATAMGIINAGTAVGAMVAPPLIAVVLGVTNWRWIFVLAGAFGLLWTAWWQSSYRPASDTSRKTRNDAREIVGLHANDAVRFPWTHLFKSVGLFAWMPNAAAGIGCLFGGSFSSYLLRRQFPVGLSRKAALGVSAAVMPFAILVPHVTVPWALTIFCLAYFGQQSWSTLVMVLPTDLFPQQVVGSVAGLVGFGGAMGGIAFGQLAGYLLDHGFGYGSVFAIAGTLLVAALLLILAALPVVRPLELRQRLRYGRGQ